MSGVLNCILTENEVRLCELALTIVCEERFGKINQFSILRDKLRKLGYEYH